MLRRPSISWIVIIGALCIGICFLFRQPSGLATSIAEVEESPTSASPLVSPTKPLLSERLLVEHGSPETEPTRDLQIIGEFVKASTMENRHLDTFYFSTNADLTEVMLGIKGKSHPQLPPDHPILGKNEYGELTLQDRWQTAYRVHLVDRNHIEIFSAGPDKKPGTPDDLTWPPHPEMLFQAGKK